MKKATYTNRETNETYTLSGVNNIGQAFNLSGIVAIEWDGILTCSHVMFALLYLNL